jgi:hypothetical protein
MPLRTCVVGYSHTAGGFQHADPELSTKSEVIPGLWLLNILYLLWLLRVQARYPRQSPYVERLIASIRRE